MNTTIAPIQSGQRPMIDHPAEPGIVSLAADHIPVSPRAALNKRVEVFCKKLTRARGAFCNVCFQAEVDNRIRNDEAKNLKGLYSRMFATEILDCNKLFKDSEFQQFIIAKPCRISRGRDVDSTVLMSSPEGDFKTKARKQVFYIEYKCPVCKVGGVALEAGADEAEIAVKKYGLNVQEAEE